MMEAGFLVLEGAIKLLVAITLDKLWTKFLEFRKDF
jgi:hypothetical protein